MCANSSFLFKQRADLYPHVVFKKVLLMALNSKANIKRSC